ncbi:MAG: hypothetical protein ACKO0Z_10400 [Betaproteobacteria bacterium]
MKDVLTTIFSMFMIGLLWAVALIALGVIARGNYELFMMGWGVFK